MEWTDLHATLLGRALDENPRRSRARNNGVRALFDARRGRVSAQTSSFAPNGWLVHRVAAFSDNNARTITADCAVEMREAKQHATLFLVDTLQAGAGMDGIYSAARHVDEITLFREALRLAKHEVTRVLSTRPIVCRQRSRKPVGTVAGTVYHLGLNSISLRALLLHRHIRDTFFISLVYGLLTCRTVLKMLTIDISRMFVERLLGTTASGLTPARRIEALRLLNPSEHQLRELEQFLRTAATSPLLPALSDLADKPQLWINALRLEVWHKIFKGLSWFYGETTPAGSQSGLDSSKKVDQISLRF